MKNWNSLIYVIGIFPWLTSISLIVFYFHARIILGWFPHYNNPDPKELEIYSIYNWFIYIFFEIAGYSLLIWIILLIAFIIKGIKNLNIKAFVFCLIGYMVLFFIILFTDIFEWYID